MAELALTAARHEELVALLDDEQRLRAQYPKVLEYLDATPLLAGTGDDRADRAFDIRLVHYMTGGREHSSNPYWDIVAPSVSVRAGRRTVDGGREKGSARLGFAQTILQSAFAYAVPSPETIQWMAEFCAGLTVIEAGAGRGYWAAQLTEAGLTVEAYDSQPPDTTDNISFLHTAGQPDVWHRIGGPREYAARSSDGQEVLFLCWPPGWGNTMASEALTAFNGERLVYIGEPKGGRTGDDAFFDALTEGWRLESEDPRFVSWWNLADTARGWVRR
ncbi:hypothetical protein [Nocardia bovistercoris]|uniref:Uncharacterized protein n=1 Tax=Nocardia bovistercoris TaxID=2785916 RepID=A0A931IFX7_9NOCA|nr:hypothetical protein [Nocardia bovistercoris]MBH0779050.1 hypothetical protein [Nocardia bovistercoris]